MGTYTSTACGLTILAAVLAGCSSLPSDIRNPPRDAVAFHESASEPDRFEGRPVLWGGEIAGVDNRDGQTWIEVVQRPLDVDGRPRDTDQTSGRFVVRVDEFLDPAVYSEGRAFTVNGVIERGAEGTIGNQPYLFPIIHADTTYLWEASGS